MIVLVFVREVLMLETAKVHGSMCDFNVRTWWRDRGRDGYACSVF